MLTVLTPVAPHHSQLFLQAVASVKAQTVSVQHLYKLDMAGQGPGAIRNELLKRVETPYVTFLDADDWLEPAFAEKTLERCQPGRYVYTDWFQGQTHVEAPDKPWCGGTWHLVTAVVPTDLARFDETLLGMEDTDFYLSLLYRGICGIRVPIPLVHYRAGGGRAHTLHVTGEIEVLRAQVNERYGGKPLGCCMDSLPIDNSPVGERQPGDILAMALWAGNRTERGVVTGRLYPRLSYPKTAWVDPRDVARAPYYWQPAKGMK